MSGSVVLDAAGRRRSPATMPGFPAGHPPRNKGLRYPADPPTVEEIVAVMRIASDGLHGRRLRGLIVSRFRVDPVARPRSTASPAACPISGRQSASRRVALDVGLRRR